MIGDNKIQYSGEGYPKVMWIKNLWFYGNGGDRDSGGS
jgi:hypothetical protein